MESTSVSVISVKYDKFWRFRFKPILQNSFVQRILLPREIGSSLPVSGQGEACTSIWSCGRARDRGGWGKWHDWCEVWRMMLEHFGSRASSPLKLWTYEYKLPQLSPVDACERQGSRMGNTECPPFSIPGVRTHLLGSTEEASNAAHGNFPGIPEIYEQGGLRKVTDDTLKALGIIIAAMRTPVIWCHWRPTKSTHVLSSKDVNVRWLRES